MHTFFLQYSKAADYIVHLARIPSPDNLKTDKGSAAGGDDLSRPQATSAAGLLLTDIKETWVANHACDVCTFLKYYYFSVLNWIELK